MPDACKIFVCGGLSRAGHVAGLRCIAVDRGYRSELMFSMNVGMVLGHAGVM